MSRERPSDSIGCSRTRAKADRRCGAQQLVPKLRANQELVRVLYVAQNLIDGKISLNSKTATLPSRIRVDESFVNRDFRDRDVLEYDLHEYGQRN